MIGNSRWHWACGAPGSLQCRSEAPGRFDPGSVTAWAATGPLPSAPGLDVATRIQTAQVPLLEAPAWLGVDRALAGWCAWRRSGSAVLVADAGTALSLTRVGAEGRFGGGRLLAGAALQLRALAAGTAALPALEAPLTLPPQAWPHTTEAALVAGVLRGLAAAVAQAAREAWREDAGCSLWITGGDGPLLLPLLQELLAGCGQPLQAEPDLALEALASLRPGPGR